MKVIGLMSGTSVDGVDVALVEITGERENLEVTLLAGETYPYPEPLQAEILAVCAGKALTISQLCAFDDRIAEYFSRCVHQLETTTHIKAALIASHGQTVFHRPPQDKLGYSVQLGRGAMIADLTQRPTVSNFRAADIAQGGQGAPLVCKVDACLLSHPTLTRCVQNIGGISNVTYLPPRSKPNWEKYVIGWDNGPGNSLLDLAVQRFTEGKKRYDKGGKWAAQGKPRRDWVEKCLESEAFFHHTPPKSTGRELFGESYLDRLWEDAQRLSLSQADFLASLTELTVKSIEQDYRRFLPDLPDEILLCGGGSRNDYLRERLEASFPNSVVKTTEAVGLDSQFKESIAFAVLGYWRYHDHFPGNLPQVTGAQAATVLGDIYHPPTKSEHSPKNLLK